MSVGFLLLIIVVLVALAVGIPSVIGYLSSDSRTNRATRRQQSAEVAAVRSREKIATKALRSIANGAGNPLFEAQDALDKIESTYTTKELS